MMHRFIQEIQFSNFQMMKKREDLRLQKCMMILAMGQRDMQDAGS